MVGASEVDVEVLVVSKRVVVLVLLVVVESTLSVFEKSALLTSKVVVVCCSGAIFVAELLTTSELSFAFSSDKLPLIISRPGNTNVVFGFRTSVF